jgi:hypothetical protein
MEIISFPYGKRWAAPRGIKTTQEKNSKYRCTRDGTSGGGCSFYTEWAHIHTSSRSMLIIIIAKFYGLLGGRISQCLYVLIPRLSSMWAWCHSALNGVTNTKCPCFQFDVSWTRLLQGDCPYYHRYVRRIARAALGAFCAGALSPFPKNEVHILFIFPLRCYENERDAKLYIASGGMHWLSFSYTTHLCFWRFAFHKIVGGKYNISLAKIDEEFIAPHSGALHLRLFACSSPGPRTNGAPCINYKLKQAVLCRVTHKNDRSPWRH